MNQKVFALITTYNPEIENLISLIEILSLQVDRVFVCNNSAEDLVALDFKMPINIEIINFRENLGIAKAQSIGMKLIFDNGADFVLQMDQDSTPHKNMTKELLRCYNELSAEGYKIGLVGVQDYDKITHEMNQARLKKGKELNNGYYDVDNTLSSGSLISREAYLAIGGMRDDLFIDAVDHEYCWRLKKSGFKVIRNKNALLGHRLGDGKFKILNLVSVGMPSPFRHYYATRNIFLLIRDSHVPLYWKMSSVVKLVGKILFYPLCMPDGKNRMKFFLKGIFDGIANRSGRMK